LKLITRQADIALSRLQKERTRWKFTEEEVPKRIAAGRVEPKEALGSKEASSFVEERDGSAEDEVQRLRDEVKRLSGLVPVEPQMLSSLEGLAIVPKVEDVPSGKVCGAMPSCYERV
jgi:hypothetical protein